MIDVDARGRHEAELLREEVAGIADTETALQSVLDGEVLVPLVTHGQRAPRPVITRDPVSVRRRVPVLVGLAAAAALVVAIALLPGNKPKVVPTSDTAVTSTELVVQPLDPPIECELDLCPSLAVSPEGTLVAYDQAAKTLTWYDAEPHVAPVTADLDAEHVQLVAIGPGDVAYFLAGSPDTASWELVAIDLSGAEINRATASSPNVERSDFGLVERSCWSGCEPATQVLMRWESGIWRAPLPNMSYTTGTVTASFGELRWTIAWPHTLSTRSQFGRRWDGGAVLSLVPESADAPSELIELLPDGSVQRFRLGDQTVHALLPDGSAVVWRDGQLVRLSPPRPAAPPAAWSPELIAQPLELPIACDRLPRGPQCPSLAVSPEGTLVALDLTAWTLTWYEDDPRVVSLSGELRSSLNEGYLIAIGPYDIAYIVIRTDYVVAVAPSGAEITGMAFTQRAGPLPTRATATGLVAKWARWPSPNAAPDVPWVDLDGNPITDTRPYPTATNTDAGLEVRLGEREWLLADEPRIRALDFVPRSDGGIVIVFDTWQAGFIEGDQVLNLLVLSPDGSTERYFVNTERPMVLPDGSMIVEHNLQLFRLTPPA